MNQTPNYNLNQWERADRVLMEDFNGDNAKLDAALAGLESAKADKTALAAAQTALSKQISQVDAAVVRMVFGTYTGDGNTYQDIALGQQPKAVLVFQENGATAYLFSTYYFYGGLALPGHPVVCLSSTAVEITASGFRVYLNTSRYIYCNTKSENFHYIAFL